MNDADSLQDYQRVRQQAIRSLFEIVEGSSEGTVIVDREVEHIVASIESAVRFMPMRSAITSAASCW